jgi:hypothetical protein
VSNISRTNLWKVPISWHHDWLLGMNMCGNGTIETYRPASRTSAVR